VLLDVKGVLRIDGKEGNGNCDSQQDWSADSAMSTGSGQVKSSFFIGAQG
jgi:hypothetical protein